MGRWKKMASVLALSCLFLIGCCEHESFPAGKADVPPLVEQWRSDVERYAEEFGVSEYVDLLLAMIAQESGGDSDKTPDVMQCSASAGLPNNSITDPVASIRQGVKYFSELLIKGNQYGVDLETVLQAYNFGGKYIDYVAKNYSGTHSQAAAEAFSNRMCSKYGYRGYGDVLYVQHVKRWLTKVAPNGNEKYDALLAAMREYEGTPYLFGGSGKSGIDCSGLTQQCFLAIGISLPRTAQEQYDKLEHVSEHEAQPGDLVFFTGTYDTNRYVTHVGIYVGNGKMFHASSRGCVYASMQTGYWQTHLIGFGRAI